MNLYHGGVAGLAVGSVVLPNMAGHRHVEGCKQCEAQRDGTWVQGTDPGTPANWVYATSDRPYARYYASRAVLGSLYRVRLVGEVERSSEDLFPTWRAGSAIVVAVLEFNVVLSRFERLKLFKRWGGTEAEYREMVQQVFTARGHP